MLARRSRVFFYTSRLAYSSIIGIPILRGHRLSLGSVRSNGLACVTQVVLDTTVCTITFSFHRRYSSFMRRLWLAIETPSPHDHILILTRISYDSMREWFQCSNSYARYRILCFLEFLILIFAQISLLGWRGALPLPHLGQIDGASPIVYSRTLILLTTCRTLPT